ncbi:MAG: TlpA family protein disulfide reductase [Alphaproteobacteria bacterium]|nr:TlpA family protein disulfide reductase [Alphaproteobacteria bacterium]MCB9792893.1 TlpA family protein disulfide reductase [Alphaproteobacteria bacterium]
MRPALYASLCLSLMACAQGVSQEDHDALAARVATLERAADVPTPMSEEEAMALYQQLDAATQAMDWDKARALLDKAKAEAGHTRVASRFARVAEEIAVIGKPAPALEVERWYQGQTDLNQGKATLVVFWEEWCPHCRREVPALEATYEQLSGEGLNVVALTRITRSSTEEKVQTFIRDSGLTYPVARLGDDKMNEAFGVSGIPAAAVVVDGEIAWRGHPGRLDAETLRRWL